MAFKASKIDIDLTLDLTEFIPKEQGGILTTKKVDGESIFDWTKFTVSEGERIMKIEDQIKKKECQMTMVEVTEESRKSIVNQIDFFYGKGQEFYKKLHMLTLKECLDYIRDQVGPVKKKLQKSRN